MQLEVYQTDGEVYEAAAALAAERLAGAAATAGRATVGLPGGRAGRALMSALAAQAAMPWASLEVFFTDEACLEAGDARTTAAIARESLRSPRGLGPGRVHDVPTHRGDARAAAAAYAAALEARLGTPPALDVVLCPLGDDGELGAMPAAGGEMLVVAVDAAAGGVARVTVTPVVLRAARQVIVTAVGCGCAGAVVAALREPVDPGRRPAQAVLPGPAVTWLVDRAAADLLLRDARPVDQ